MRMNKKIGFVICSRIDSERIPGKVLRKLNGTPVIVHLISRLQKSGLPIYLAFPRDQFEHYKFLAIMENVFLYPADFENDPLGRMTACALNFGLDDVIRVTHDKIFVESNAVTEMVKAYYDEGSDYLYSSDFTPGCSFEIISTKCLVEASDRYNDVEFVGYAIRTVAKKIIDFPIDQPKNYRFLIDFPEDLQFLEVVFSQLGNDVALCDVIKYLRNRNQIKRINQLPQVTVYTCAKNADAFISQAMASVEKQIGFRRMEYILIDDFSTDKTPEYIANFCAVNKNAYWIRNERNLGLSSSSNIALKKAKGKYIIRLDADDYFTNETAISELLEVMKQSNSEIVYPDNYFGQMDIIQQGNEVHHVAGALFDKSALMHLKFTEGLKGHDSLDIFLRAKDHLAIAYYKEPIFFYRQHAKSLTKNNLAERENIKKSLLLKHSDSTGEKH